MKKSPETQQNDFLPPEVQVGKMILGKFTTQLLYAAAKLELADLLKDGPKHIEELAATAGVHSSSLYRVLRALASLGVFSETEPMVFALTPLAETLLADSPVSQKNLALLMGSEFHNLAWANIMHCLKTGESAFKDRFGLDFSSYLDRHPEVSAILQGLMTASSEQEADELCHIYDFSGFETVVDVGGGQGMLLARILTANPRLKGILLDSPSVVEGAQRLLHLEALRDRLEISGGDFFEGIPTGGDVYILKRVIHDWDDERSSIILKNCREAMKAHGRVLVIEQVILPGDAPSFGKLADIEMMVMSEGGRERTLSEFQQLFSRAGLELNRVVSSKSWSILDAIDQAG